MIEKEKQLKKLTALLRTLYDLERSEDPENFLENNDIDAQELLWGCQYYLEEYKKYLEKEI